MILRWTVISAFALTVLVGCHHRRDTGSTVAAASDVPVVSVRRTRRLLQIASRDLSCPTESLMSEQVTERIYRVRGCNDWRDYAIFGRGRRGPARWRRIVPIADRAQADFACAAAQINFTPTSATSYTAIGCGKVTGYELRCTDRDCGWVGAAPSSGTYSASVVIIVPATDAPLSIDVDGEADDAGGDE